MLFLAVKTRGNSSPQGKRRVYFLCHPNDFNKYFNEIADDIFKFQNCAIYYKDINQEYSAEELFVELNQMQMFVVPITTKLLTDFNPAITVEISFAAEHHIPILPLMQETELDDLFTEKFGDLQYLDKNNHDVTAISYEDKLERFLSSVLVGDKLAQQIRDAFDAYVFLSYRKKDRVHAQELMRLIHKNDFAQSIAIWYDEFLIPGENFNDAIAEAMEKSGLFALAVTPNLINEPNYVMSVEYPEAIKHHKPILPVELVQTDRDALEKHYPSIPDCTNAYDTVELSQHLLASLQNIALSENNADPQHKLFIGIAYLNGIDVEVEHERALSMITESANAELPEAIEWLVKIYRNGISVPKDNATAIAWQERLVQIRETNYKKDTNKENCISYIADLSCLSNLYIDVCNYDRAKSISERQLEICKTEEAKCQLYGETSDTYFDLGKISELLGNVDNAFSFYNKSLAGWGCISSNNNSEKAAFTKATIQRRLGDLFYDTEKVEDALRCYHLGISEIETINADKPSHRGMLSSLYYDVARLYSNTDRNDQALIWYDKAIKIDEQLSVETSSSTYKINLALSYIMYAKALADKYSEIFHFTFKARKEKSKIIEFLNKAITISNELLEQEDMISKKLICSSCYLTAADICWQIDEMSDSNAYQHKAVSLAEEIYSRIPTVSHIRHLAVVYSDIGQFKHNDPQKSLEHFLKGYEISKKLIAYNIAKDLYSHGLICYFLSDAYLKQKQITESKKYLEEGLSCLDQIHDQKYSSKLVLSNLLHLQAKINKHEGDNNKALTYLLEELRIREDITSNADALSPYMDLSDVYSELSTINLKLGNDMEASKWGILAAKAVLKKTYNPNKTQNSKINFTKTKIFARFYLLFGIIGLLCAVCFTVYLAKKNRFNVPIEVAIFQISVPAYWLIAALTIAAVILIITGLIYLKNIRTLFK